MQAGDDVSLDPCLHHKVCALSNGSALWSMPTATAEPSTHAHDTSLPPAGSVDQFDPQQVRVVDVEAEHTDEVVRRDCYDPQGSLTGDDLDGVQTVFQLVDGEVYVRAIDWARSDSMKPSVDLRWVPTGMQAKEVGRIRVFTWPNAELFRVFKDTA